MDKSTLLLLAIVLAIFGGSVALGHPDWGTFTGLAIIVLAAGLASGTLPIRARDFLEERAAPTQRVSNGLVTLSSAAIVAIYAAGYHRTSLAAHKFDLQSLQGRASTEVVNVVPPASNPPNSASRGVSQNGTSTEKKPLPRPARKEAAPKSSAARAPASTPSAAGEDASASPAAATRSQYTDGTFSGWGSCPHGDIEATVMIQNGKIASVVISQCLTRYSCNWIAPKNPDSGLPDLPAQVVQRQNAKVDYVSGATESSYAFADAVVAALSKATE